MAYALRLAEAGTAVAEICRKLGICEQTFYHWMRNFAGMGIYVSEECPTVLDRPLTIRLV